MVSNMSSMLFRNIENVLQSELQKQVSGAVSPELLQNLIHEKGIHPSGLYTSKDRAIARQLAMFRKRYTDDSDSNCSELRKRTCHSKFVLANDLCAQQNAMLKEGSESALISRLLNRAYSIIDSLFYSAIEHGKLNPLWMGDSVVLTEGFAVGKGVCSESEGTNVVDKYIDSLHFSSANGVRRFDVISKLSKPVNMLPPMERSIVDALMECYVPKDSETDRMVVPQLNGDIFLQYPVGFAIEVMLTHYGLDITKQQTKQREMARIGSTFDNLDAFEFSLKRRRPRWCTIDATSASDIIGQELYKRCFPDCLYKYMNDCRPLNLKSSLGDTTRIEAMAMMGNAYCFPGMTLIFACLVQAIYEDMGIPVRDSYGNLNFGVYGDDIIVDVTAYDTVIRVMSELYMVPNRTKSFSYMFFRESCGGDFFGGYNIRPVMPMSVGTDESKYTLVNRLVEWGLLYSIDVSSTCSFILGHVTKALVVPLHFPHDAGFKVDESALSHLPPQWKRNVKARCDTEPVYERSYRYVLGLVWPDVPVKPSPRSRYCSYDVTHLKVVTAREVIRLFEDCTTLFYVLWGGVVQSRHTNDQCVFYVAAKERQRTSVETSNVHHWNGDIFMYADSAFGDHEITRDIRNYSNGIGLLLSDSIKRISVRLHLTES
jgi:hypothetical protein